MPMNKQLLYSTQTLYKDGQKVEYTELFSPRGNFMGIIVNKKLVWGYKKNGVFIDKSFKDCEIHLPTAESIVRPKVSNRYNSKGEWVGYDYEDPKIISVVRYFREIEDACCQKNQVGLAEASSWSYAHQIGPRPRIITHLGYLDRHRNLITVHDGRE